MKLQWNQVGERRYEAGVDRGVLYIGGKAVPWNGLIGVDEAPVGGESESYYLDGMKYLDESAPEEYGATVEAYTYPTEFSECIGRQAFGMGFYVDHQPRKSFDLAYRTMVGDDIKGKNASYKIHLVYNALAKVSNRSYRTHEDKPTATPFSYSLSTTPVQVSGHRFSSHLVLDSRETYPALLSALEDILYGTSDSNARMPTPVELKSIFDVWMKVIDLGNGVWSVTCGEDILTVTPDGQFTLNWPNATYLDANTYTISSV